MPKTMPRNGTAVDKTKDEKDRQKIINPKKSSKELFFGELINKILVPHPA